MLLTTYLQENDFMYVSKYKYLLILMGSQIKFLMSDNKIP